MIFVLDIRIQSMNDEVVRRLRQIPFILFFVFVGISNVFAHKIAIPANAPSSYEAECASCHMAYPPGLLGEKNWKNIMSTLSSHFGVDASLDPKDQLILTAWLIKNAATQKNFSALTPQNRITKATWFIHEHSSIKPEVWRRAGVKSPSNCGACHKKADIGIFHDTDIQIPLK